MPPSVDDVTQAMVEWALSPNHYPRRKPKPAHHTQIKPPARMPSPSPLLQDKTRAAKERPIGKLPTVPPEEFIKFVSPQELQLDVPRSPSTHKPHNPPGAVRRSPQQPASNHREQRLPYDEPSPDYEDDYKKYYSRYDKQYYREGCPDEDFYNHDRYSYEDRGAADPYRYNSARDGYQEHQQYPSHQGHGYDYSDNEYREPQYSYEAQRSPYQQPEYSYEAQGSPYQQPEYSYEVQRSPYQQPSPYYRSEPQQYSREYQQPRSSYDVLY
ncbi:chromosomal replication initiator protein DnaA-like [Portunus trituberculatus]|uniref:chromosomal replication initiator protein DnaA-like n=1 Tax=Portunus trituberculatus TaxID=210409 RepID=UPI001E1CFD36|nr:chromosomal replication initiator protein DnaA-like [Portunus trituberculatus]